MKPWENTWHVDESGTLIRDERDYRIAETIELDVPPQEFGNARLIAQAPAMARLLLSAEADDLAGDTACSVCRGIVQDAHHDRETGAELSPKAIAHKPDCERARVLRAAGVL